MYFLKSKMGSGKSENVIKPNIIYYKEKGFNIVSISCRKSLGS